MKKLIVLTVLFCLTGLLFIGIDFSEGVWAQPENVGDPILLAPAGKVDLGGKETLEFRWTNGMGHSVLRNYFALKVYQNDAGEQKLIYQDQVEPNRFRTEVDTSLFEAGKDYTWSLQHVIGPQKSNEAWFRFKVIAK